MEENNVASERDLPDSINIKFFKSPKMDIFQVYCTTDHPRFKLGLVWVINPPFLEGAKPTN